MIDHNRVYDAGIHRFYEFRRFLRNTSAWQQRAACGQGDTKSRKFTYKSHIRT